VTRRQLISLLAVGVVPSAGWAFAIWIRNANGLLTMNGHILVVRDYLWLWGAGHLLQVGDVATIFNPLAFATWLRGVYGPQLDDFVWGYPPSMLFLALPAAHASILSGFALFTIAQMALLWCVGRFAGLSRGVLVAALISPAAIENALGGQNGAMTSALLVGGLTLAGRQSILSGVLLGLLTVKPQLGLVTPFLPLVIGKRSRQPFAHLSAFSC
jgi:glycosyl transferase family 87